MFEKHGFHGVTVNQIVEDVGTSKGGFYHHFSSKDELLYVIHDLFITYVLEKGRIANEMYKEPVKRLQAILRDFVKVFDLYKPHLSVFYQEAMYLKPEYDKQIKKKRDDFRKIIIDVIRDGKESGDFRSDIEIEITSMAILGMVNWTHKWYKKSGEKSIEEISDIYIDLVLHSVLKTDTLVDDKIKKELIESPYLTETYNN